MGMLAPISGRREPNTTPGEAELEIEAQSFMDLMAKQQGGTHADSR